jgi:cobalt-zinc-cadmium efflux system protein
VRTVSDSRARRALWIALGANAGLLAAELLGGFAFASLALLADAAHLATDVVGLAVALVAQTLVTRPASDRRTFGLRRAEALGAQANALLVLGAAVWIAVEAVGRLGTGHEVDGAGVVAVAAVALALNGVSAAVLAGVAGRRLNLRAALVHLLADVGSSFAVLIAGVGVLAFAADWLDPVASLAIAALVV